MLTFLREYSLPGIKTKFILLYLLNVTDIIFTRLLLGTGVFVEINALIANVVLDSVVCILLKILLPAVLLTILYQRMHRATERQLKISNIILNLAVAFYLLVNISHLAWLCAYYFYFINA
ncbi:MAG: hypothetical protein GX352_03220 [Clostridiales bacterium]|nr:hypothetical protein [Clostridiales bacterium]